MQGQYSANLVTSQPKIDHVDGVNDRMLQANKNQLNYLFKLGLVSNTQHSELLLLYEETEYMNYIQTDITKISDGIKGRMTHCAHGFRRLGPLLSGYIGQNFNLAEDITTEDFSSYGKQESQGKGASGMLRR